MVVIIPGFLKFTAAGYTLGGRWEDIGHNRRFLYPVYQVRDDFWVGWLRLRCLRLRSGSGLLKMSLAQLKIQKRF